MATVADLYRQVLGREADPGGLAYYQNLFGPTIEPTEVNTFLSGIAPGTESVTQEQARQAALNFVGNLPAMPGGTTGGTTTINLPPVNQPVTDTTNLFTGGGSQGATVNLSPTQVTNPLTDRAYAENLVRQTFQTVLGRQPLDEGLNYWMNEIMSGRVSPSNIASLVASGAQNEDIAAAQNWLNQNLATGGGGLTSSPLTTTGESQIDPTIAPYLSEALGISRNLFVEGGGPSLYPGQMYVSPSQPTLDALAAAETLGRSTTATGLGADVLGAYKGGLSTLSSLASPDYMKSQEYKDYVESVTRPVREAVTEEIIPAIQSGFSLAGRYGGGAMGDVVAKSTGKATTALGDITSQIAQRERENQLSALGYMPSFLGGLSGVVSGALAPSGILAGVGAQREAIAGQPLQEAIKRYEYTQNLPYNQLSGYLSSIYGSPLGSLTQPPQPQGNTALQNIGGVLSTAAAIPGAVRGVQTLGSLFF